MSARPLLFLPCLILALSSSGATAEEAWAPLDARGLRSELRGLVHSARKVARLDSLATSPGGVDVLHVELGTGSDEERSRRPAMLLVAGVDGTDLFGTSIAVDWIRELLEAHDSQKSDLLRTTTIHVVPRLSPDAASRYFASPRMADGRSPRGEVDDDHDGLFNEDPPDDLDGDGLIRSMRVKDALGTHVQDDQDERLLIEADAAQAEVGAWRSFSEGRDDDGDESFNEDGLGGVNIDRNFSYNFEWFAPDSGVHQVSELESRGLADFLLEHPNIGLVFTLGAEDNLVAPPPAAKKTPSDSLQQEGRRRRPRSNPPKELNADDLDFYEHFGEQYREAMGISSKLTARSHGGSFSSWCYFHRGRASLAARAWSPELQVAIDKAQDDSEEAGADASEEAAPEASESSGESAAAEDEDKAAGRKRAGKAGKKGKEAKKDDRGKAEREVLAWFDENSPGSFKDWQVVDHPDFPGKQVEVGGYAPFAFTHPPDGLVEATSRKQRDFLNRAAGSLPRVAFRSIETRHLGRGVHELKVRVENVGYLPTQLAHGVVTRATHPTRLEIDLDEGAFLAGTRVTKLGVLPGSGGMEEARFVVHLKAPDLSARLTLVSALGGTAHGLVTWEGGR